MTTFLELALVNAVLVSIIACVVFAITRIWRNPHLAHVLWLVVLLKMVTPPLVRVPVWFGFEWNSGKTTSTAPSELSTSEWTSSIVAGQAGVVAFESEKALAVFEESQAEQSYKPAMGHETITRANMDNKARSLWPLYVGVAWMSGSLLYALFAGVRIMRFHRRLKETDVAGENLHRIGESVASEFGLKQVPELRITDGNLGPMVWPVGSPPIVVLPSGLLAKLGEEQLSADARIISHFLQ